MRLHWGVGLAFAGLGCGGMGGPLFGVGGRGGGGADSSSVVGTGAGGEGGEGVTVGPTSASSSTSSSSAGGGTGGAPPECTVPSDCPGIDNACQTRTCWSGKCDANLKPDGWPAGSDVVGDCTKNQCNGGGIVVSVTDLADPADDGEPCTDDVCNAPGYPIGSTTHPPKAKGAPCVGAFGAAGKAGVCSENHTCVECLEDPHCGYVPGCPFVSLVGRCNAYNKCVAGTCNDGAKNQCEPFPDCGGPCPDPSNNCN